MAGGEQINSGECFLEKESRRLSEMLDEVPLGLDSHSGLVCLCVYVSACPAVKHQSTLQHFERLLDEHSMKK